MIPEEVANIRDILEKHFQVGKTTSSYDDAAWEIYRDNLKKQAELLLRN